MRISCFDIPSTVNDLLMKGEEQLLEMAIMYHGQSWALVPKLFVAAKTLRKYDTSKLPANIYLFKKRCEVCSKLTSVFIVNFEHILHLFLAFLLLTLNK